MTAVSRTALARFRIRGRRYARHLWWLAVDSIWRFRGTTMLVQGSSFAALLAQIGALAVAATYANALKRGGSIDVLGTPHEARESMVLLALCAALVLVALLISAWLAYVSGLQSIVLRRKYQEFSTRRALERLYGQLFVWRAPTGSAADTSDYLRVARGDAGILARSAQLLVNGIMPAITCVLAAGTLFYLEPLSTLVIAVITLTSIMFLYRANVRAADASRAMEHTLLPAGRIYGRQLAALRESPTTHDAEAAAWCTAGPAGKYLDARDKRSRAMEFGRFVSNLFLAVSIFVVIVAMGASIIKEGAGWDRLLVYLFALRHGLVNLRGVTSTLTSVNRFYPQLRRMRAFLRRSSAGSDALLDHATLACPDGPVITKPRRVVVYGPVAANRYTAGFLAETLFGEKSAPAILNDLWVVSPPPRTWPTPPSLGVATGLERDVANDPCLAALPERPSLATPVSDVDAGTVATHAIAAAYAAGRSWILINGRVLDTLPPAVADAWSNRADEAIVVVVTDDSEIVRRLSPELVVVMDEEAIVGHGDFAWFTTHHDELSPRAGAEDGDLDADLEDEEQLLEA